jgi:Cdc6-like AAA superfamily ATPase
MINRVSSRIGLTRLTFSPYTHHQLQEIVTARLTGLSVFDKDAIQLVSRKVASLSGDARRALDICRRATEIAQSEGPQSLVGITHVTEAHKEMFCSPKIMAIRCCSKYERYFMQSMVAVFQKTGIEEATFDRVLLSMTEVLQFEDLTALTVDEAHNIVGRLQACRLILSEPGKTGRLDAKLRLNVSQDDVLFALKNEDQ